MLVRTWRKRNTPPLLVGLHHSGTLWKSVWRLLSKLDIALPEDPAIPLLGIYLEDVPTCNKDTCSIKFIAALFIIAKSGNSSNGNNGGMDTYIVVWVGEMAKSTNCFSIGHEFKSQQPHGGLQPFIIRSNDLFWSV